MAVEIKYVVVRNGEEKMTFVSKKEADAYDRMLDLADELAAWLQRSPVALEESQREELALFLAREKEQLQTLLRGGKTEAEPTLKRPKKAAPASTDEPA